MAAGWLSTSVEHGFLEQASPNKFHAAIAFYPPCRHFKGDMTVPTLILIGERDDVTPAEECRNMVDGRDAWGISRQKDRGAPIKLIVYPDAYHAFDAPSAHDTGQAFGAPSRIQPVSNRPIDRRAPRISRRNDWQERVSHVTIKAVVFDAYGTLYDIQSVASVTEQAFPGYGEIITQVWRIKQLEYTWLRSLMRRYEDFSDVTRESLAYTLRCLGLKYDEATFAGIMDKYLHLDLYPDALASLAAMRDKKLAILSNGSPDMLDALVKNSGLDRVLDATISVDANKIFKPSPDAYSLDRKHASHSAARGPVHLLEPVGRLRRQGVRAQRRLDRAGDAGGDGAGLRESRSRRRRSRCSRRSAPRWTNSGLSPTIASMRSPNCPPWCLPKVLTHEP